MLNAKYTDVQLKILEEIGDEIEKKQKTMVAWRVINFIREEIMKRKDVILSDDAYGLALLLQLPLWVENSGIDCLKTSGWKNIIIGHVPTYDDVLVEFLPQEVINRGIFDGVYPDTLKSVI